MNIFLYRDYRQLLEAVLAQRRQRNPSYSMRRFAGMIGISPSRLSEILRGMGKLSLVRAREIAENIGFNPEEEGYFLLLVRLELVSKERQHQIQFQLSQLRYQHIYRTIDGGLVCGFPDHVDMALLEFLTHCTDFSESQSLAQTLGISVDRMKEGLHRLESWGLARFDEIEGVYRPAATYYRTGKDFPKSDIRAYQKGLIERGIYSLENDPVAERNFQSKIFSLPLDRYQELVKVIENFILQLGEDHDRQGCHRVYALAVQLFPISRVNETTGSNCPSPH